MHSGPCKNQDVNPPPPPTPGVRLPDHDEPVGPVTILDGQGRVVRVVPAREFRPTLVAPTPPTLVRSRRPRSA